MLPRGTGAQLRAGPQEDGRSPGPLAPAWGPPSRDPVHPGPELHSLTSSPSCGQRGLRRLFFVLQGLFWRRPDGPPCSHHRVLVNQRNQSGHLRTLGTSWQGPKGQGLVPGLLYPCLAHLQRLEGKRGCKMRGTHHYLASQQAQGASLRRPPRAELLGEWRVLEGLSSAVAPGTLRKGGDRRWKTALCDTVAWP